MKSNTIGGRIKELRKSAGMTQKEFATRIRKSYSAVQKYEIGVTIPPLNVLRDIALVFDVYINDLIEGTEINWSNIDNPAKKISEASANVSSFDRSIAQSAIDQASKEAFQEDDNSSKTRILRAYNLLNDQGRNVAASRIEELTQIPAYQKPTRKKSK